MKALRGLLVALPLLVATGSAAPDSGEIARETAALYLAAGSVARHELVAVGRDVVVDGEALSHVAAIDGSVRISGRVAGDVIVLGGDVELLHGAQVDGDAYVLGGALATDGSSSIAGRAVSYPAISDAWLTLLEGPSLGADPFAPVVLATKIALLVGWLILALVLFPSAGRELMSTSESIQADPVRNFAIGLTAVLTMLMIALGLGALSLSVVGLPLVFLLVLFGVILKLWGMVAVFHAVGSRAAAWIRSRRVLPLTAATLGLLLLGGFKLIPLVGLWAWWIATFIGMGASLATKFGRRQPWVQTAQLEDFRRLALRG